jgi:YbbR domain-containing protein
VRNPFGQVRIFGTPLLLAILSLVAAIVLWVAVTEAENPTATVSFTSVEVRAVNVPEGQAVARISDPAVGVVVSAPSDVVGRLTPGDLRVEVDLAGVTQSVSEQRVIATVVTRREYHVLEVTPPIVTVHLEPIATRTVPVHTNFIGTLPQGFERGEIEVSPTQVRVVGARSLIESVDVAAADVNLTGLRVTTRQQYPLVPRDSRGADIRGVRVEPSSAEVRVVVLQQEVTLTLTVQAMVQGTVADGYNLVSVTVDPPAVPVFGPLEILQATFSVPTQPVDVSGLRSDATRSVRLNLPAALQSTRENVTVRVRVVPALGEITIATAPQVTGLGDGLRASVQTSTVNVRLGGELPTLRALQPGSVRASVSASGLGEGVHLLTPTVSAPEGILVVSIDPAQVVVSIHR